MSEHVMIQYACPRCGNDEMDELVWIDDGDRVQCQKCGREYSPDEQAARFREIING